MGVQHMLAFKTQNCLDGKGQHHMQKSGGFILLAEAHKSSDVKYWYLLTLSTEHSMCLML